jgi:hypothetical protein
MHLLLSSGMRKAEVTTLNRTDVDEGWADSEVIVGKGSQPPDLIGVDEA